MTKTEYVNHIASKHLDLPIAQINKAVNIFINRICQYLQNNQRVEIRGLGSFAIKLQARCWRNNPRTGEKFVANEKYIICFRASKLVKDRLNAT